MIHASLDSLVVPVLAATGTPRSTTRDAIPVPAAALLKRAAWLDARDKDGMTPLHHAAMCSNNPAALALIEAGADADAKDTDDAPLHHAAANRNPVAYAALAEHGADITARTNSGKTPLDDAILHANPEIARTILESPTEIITPTT